MAKAPEKGGAVSMMRDLSMFFSGCRASQGESVPRFVFSSRAILFAESCSKAGAILEELCAPQTEV